MVTYYFRNPEEALKRAKAASKQSGCRYGGIPLRSGKRGWAIYKDGKVVEQYAVMRNRCFFLYLHSYWQAPMTKNVIL